MVACVAFVVHVALTLLAQAKTTTPDEPQMGAVGGVGQITTRPSLPIAQATEDHRPRLVVAPDGSPEADPQLRGDDIAIGWRFTQAADERHDGWGYHVFVTNLVRDGAGNMSPAMQCDPDRCVLRLQREYPLILFNLIAAVEWDASPQYLACLETAFDKASDYLYDLSDGQMAIGKVTIVDYARLNGTDPDRQDWRKSADIRFVTSNDVIPKHLNATTSPSYQGIQVGASLRSADVMWDWCQPHGYRTLIHELGHHALGLYDEYVDRVDDRCTDTPAIMSTHPITAASAMAWQFAATEFSARPPLGQGGNPVEPWTLWSDTCATMPHFKKTGRSVWESLDKRFSDTQSPARWDIVTPAERGSVMAGPASVPAAFPWPKIEVISYVDEVCRNDEAACSPVAEVCVDNAADLCGSSSGAKVSIMHPDGSSDMLGVLGNNQCIRLVDAKPRSQLFIACRHNFLTHSVTIDIQPDMISPYHTSFPETGPVLPPIASSLFSFSPPGLESAANSWTDNYLTNMQDVSARCPKIAPDLFGPQLDLLNSPEDPISLLNQQGMALAGLYDIAGPQKHDAAEWKVGDPLLWQDLLWWQQPAPEDAAGAPWRNSLTQAVPMLQGAFLRQANIDCRALTPVERGFLITPDEVWVAEIPPQQTSVEVAIESINAWPGEVLPGEFQTGFTLSASGPIDGPVKVSYLTNCGPSGGRSDLVLVKTPGGEEVKPAAYSDCHPVAFTVPGPGTYQLRTLSSEWFNRSD
jgi:hypothetical protein